MASRPLIRSGAGPLNANKSAQLVFPCNVMVQYTLGLLLQFFDLFKARFDKNYTIQGELLLYILPLM